jgi:hypothetical protein
VSQPPEPKLVDRFASAVRKLVDDGPIKQRLALAYSEHLEDLTDGELPAPLRAPFGALRSALSRVEPAGSESRVRANVQKMSAREAGGHACSIVALYVDLLTQTERAEPLKVVSNGKKPPRYLAHHS